LFNLIQRLSQARPDVTLVLCGRLESGVTLPANCLHLGYIDDEQVVDVLRSANLVLCANKPGDFGDFSYPVKIYEALSVGVPVVAFATPSVEFVMRDNKDGLVSIHDIDHVAERTLQLLDHPYAVESPAADWESPGRVLFDCLGGAVTNTFKCRQHDENK
jgi:glycosyltransferase involved in cell wall biosynthesis